LSSLAITRAVAKPVRARGGGLPKILLSPLLTNS
jgi:hypothetical protein